MSRSGPVSCLAWPSLLAPNSVRCYAETDAAPILTKHRGESAAGEVERLLDRYAGPDATVLDLGNSAGQTLCRLAPRVRAIYGFDQERRPADGGAGTRCVPRYHKRDIPSRQLSAIRKMPTRCRIGRLRSRSVGVAEPERGVPAAETEPDAVLVQELVSEQDGAGLKEIFGRKPFVPRSHGDADHVIESYGGLEMLPVSAKSYWSEQYFRDHSLRLIERWRLDHNQVRPHSAHRGLPPAKACLLAAGARPGLVDGPAARPLAPSPITCYQPEGLPS